MKLSFGAFVCETDPQSEIRKRLRGGERLSIITLNPEMCVKAWREMWFFHLIQTADIVTIDGAGLAIALSLIHHRQIKRTTGVELLEQIHHLLPHRETPISLLGGEDGARAKMKERFQTESLNVISLSLPQISSTFGQPPDLSQIDWQTLEHQLEGIVYIALSFGAQEAVAQKVMERCPKVIGVVGVGGAFNTLSGCLRRAPAWCRAIGCEWVWRLLLEPKRIKRIFTATIVFPLLGLQRALFRR